MLAIVSDATFAKRLQQEAPRWGLRLEVISDRSTVQHRLTQTTPEVILLALDGDGADNPLALLQTIKADYPAMPIVILSDPESMRRAFAVGANDVLGKPVVEAELVTRMISRIKQLGQ